MNTRFEFLGRLLVLGSFPAPAALAQTTWYVDAAGTPPGAGTRADPYTSLQHAIDQATTGHEDTLLVAPGTYLENIDYSGKRLRIVAREGAEATVVRAAHAGPVVIGNASGHNPGAWLEGFTVTGAQGDAPGIHVVPSTGSFLGVRDCIVRDNGGPGLSVDYDMQVLATTLVGNERGFVTGSVGALFLANSISWGNALPPILGPFPANFIFYCDLETTALGGGVTNCFSADPRFWDLAGRNLALRADSPCIDAGDPASPPDPDGSRIDLGALPYDPFHAPGTSTHCDGTAALCPCGNGGAPGAGCEIAQGTGGVAIGIRDFLPDGAGGGTAAILGTGYPPAATPGVTLIRSPALELPPVPFGDGLRCIATAGLVRVRATLATGGAVELSLSHGAGAGSFHYQLWNRNAPAAFCTPDAFNLSNALTVTW